MHIQARRVFRLAFVPALALAAGYALKTPLPFLAPLFAFFLTIKPAAPLGLKKTISLLILVTLTTGLGILLVPLLLHFQLAAVLLVLLGIYFSSYLTVNLKKILPATFIMMGLTMVSAAGTINHLLAVMVIQGLLFGIVIAILCQNFVSLFFPEDNLAEKNGEPSDTKQSSSQELASEKADISNWIAIRSTMIVLPVYLLLLVNPGMYMPIMMKSVMLSQQSSTLELKDTVKEMLGSTFLGGLFAILFWMLLGIWPNLFMFAVWMLLLGLYFSSKIYGILKSRLSASFWLNTAITMLILLGPAVEDSNTGKDVYTAFFIRMSLFVAVTFYALAAIYFLELFRPHKWKRSHAN